ncbi:MAG: TIGR00730 family Rossman fold protein [Chromatiales bacterium]|nr:TIGR00730 family Rossman fold protein [Chromatiales bacterium]
MSSKAPCRRESWKIFQIMAEFVEGFERLAQIQPVGAASSARPARRPAHPYYAMTEEIARQLSDAGFAVVSGGGPGIMEAANKGAYAGKAPERRASTSQLPHEQHGNAYQDISLTFRHFFARKVMFVKYASRLRGAAGRLRHARRTDARSLTLIQTGKSRRIPIILVHTAVLGRAARLVLQAPWCRKARSAREDLDLIDVCDDPQDVLKLIFRYYEHRGFEPSREEEQTQLNL